MVVPMRRINWLAKSAHLELRGVLGSGGFGAVLSARRTEGFEQPASVEYPELAVKVLNAQGERLTKGYQGYDPFEISQLVTNTTTPPPPPPPSAPAPAPGRVSPGGTAQHRPLPTLTPRVSPHRIPPGARPDGQLR